MRTERVHGWRRGGARGSQNSITSMQSLAGDNDETRVRSMESRPATADRRRGYKADRAVDGAALVRVDATVEDDTHGGEARRRR